MSWCRWSTEVNNEQSSLYIYDSVGDNITIHVAGRKRANFKDNPHKLPKIKEYQEKYGEAWIDPWSKDYSEVHKKHSDWMEQNTIWEDLPEKWAGKSYTFEYNELDGMRSLLTEMKNDGIVFPEYVFEFIDDMESVDDD